MIIAGIVVVALALPAASQPAPDSPFPQGIHRELIERVSSSESGEYNAVLDEFDRHIRASPEDPMAVVERCRFVTHYAYQEDATIESAYDDSEACIGELSADSYASIAEVRLFLLEQKWGEEAIAEAEQLLKGARKWSPAQRAALHARLSTLHSADDPDQSGKHAMAAVELDPATGLQLGAAEYLIRIGAKRKAVEAIRTLPVDQWNSWTLQEAVRLSLLAGDPQSAFRLVTEKAGIELNRTARFGLVRALFNGGDRKSGETLLAAAEKLPVNADEAAFPDLAGKRELFALRRDYGTAEEAVQAYEVLRDTSWRADPFGWYRLSLVEVAVSAPWSLRDLLGPGALIVVLGLIALIPAIIIVPIHYRSVTKRLRGFVVEETTELSPWGLRHAWYAIASLLVVMTATLYVFAYSYFESLLQPFMSGFPYLSATIDDRALGKSLCWGGVFCLIALLPLARHTTARSFLATRCSTLWAFFLGFGLALGFLMVAGLFKGMMTSTGLAVGVASDTIRSMRGIEQAYGPFAMIGYAAVLTPIMEEFVFRGVLLRSTARHLALWAAVGIQALAFALWHEDPADYPVMFLFAIGAGWLALRTGGLLAPITFHATVNLIMSIQVLIFGWAMNQAS